MRPKTSFLRVIVVVGVAASALGGASEPAFCQEDPLNAYPLRPPNTASPRDTLLGFKQQMRVAIENWQSSEVATTLEDVLARAMRYLDLSELPPAVRQDQGSETAVLLLEVLKPGRAAATRGDARSGDRGGEWPHQLDHSEH